MRPPLVPCPVCRRHMREAESGCPFCRAPRSSHALLGAVVSAAVGCGTPAPRPEIAREPGLPAVPSDAATPDAPVDARPDARPDAAVAVVPVDAAVVAGRGTVQGHVFRSNGTRKEYASVGLTIRIGNDWSQYRSARTDAATKGAYQLTDIPPGTYTLFISDDAYDGDAEVQVVIGPDQHVKLDIDLSRIPLRRRPPKPYGAPPARRRVV